MDFPFPIPTWRVRLPLAAIASFLLLGLVGCDASGSYRRKNGGWTHDGVAIAPEDPASFRPLGDRFARDLRRGYYRGVAIADSEGASFEALSDHEARDRRAVYYGDTERRGQEYWSIRRIRVDVIPGADPATYRVLGHGYASDARHVYADGVPFEVRDVATFVPIDGDFGRDSQRGYYARVEIAGSHGPTFETIAPDDLSYVRDRTRVYHGSIEPEEPGPGTHRVVRSLKDADPATLRVVGRGYALDPSHVWYRGERLAGADAGSFVVDASFVGDADATDRVGRWSRGARLPVITPSTRSPSR